MALKVIDIISNSLMSEYKVQKGDELLEINGNRIKDILDYRFYASDEFLKLKFRRNDMEYSIDIEKEFYKDMGLRFNQMKYRKCVCNCIFCFIDQMHPDSRPSLKIKDDDYRLSFLLGNYITLANLNKNDYQRIFEQKLSPLYISVHTTDDDLRQKIMRYKKKFSILDKLRYLAQNNIKMHTQIVLVPNYNDKDELDKTVMDLSKLYPHVQTIGIVPVGLTKYREKLKNIKSFGKSEAAQLITKVEKWRKNFWQTYGSGIVQLADEFYLLAKKDVPPAEYYEGFEQLENGIGMVRQFIDDGERIINNLEIPKNVNSISLVTGTLAYPIIKDFAKKISEFYNFPVDVIKVKNEYLGEKVTVSGLLSAKDVIREINSKAKGDLILLPKNMFNTEGLSLDDKTVEDIKEETDRQIQVL